VVLPELWPGPTSRRENSEFLLRSIPSRVIPAPIMGHVQSPENTSDGMGVVCLCGADLWEADVQATATGS